MKQSSTLIAVLTVIIVIGCTQTSNNTKTAHPVTSQPKGVQTKQLYTAFNIWRMKSHNMNCINYKYGHDILPAGTKVRNVDINRESRTNRKMITFESEEDNQIYNIYFTKRWHPGKTIEDYKNLMISAKSFEELTEDMSEQEILAIKEGIVLDGISKDTVLVAYGYPPGHRTESLYNNRWIYWKNKYVTFDICFDKNDRTIPCQ